MVEDVIKRDERDRPVPLGTKITDDLKSTDRDTLFPLQGALGYSITQSLFIGENTLLVEGASDILYLQALSHEIDKRGGVSLDPRWTLCPAGSIDNIRPFVSLFAGNHLNTAVLSDQSQGDKSKIERIRSSEILAAEQFHTIAELLNKDEADIEDLFAPELFCHIVNEAYDLKGEHQITPEKLTNTTNSERQVKQADAYFNLLPDSMPTYSHFRPAYWLIRNGDILSGDSEPVKSTLKRAEQIFKTYNELLP